RYAWANRPGSGRDLPGRASFDGTFMRRTVVVFLTLLVTARAPAQPAAEPLPLSGWQFRWGNAPRDDRGQPIWADGSGIAWHIMAEWGEWPNRPARRGLWLKTLLPARLPESPAVFFSELPNGIEVYVAGRLIHSAGDFDEIEGNWHRESSKHRTVRLPPEA